MSDVHNPRFLLGTNSSGIFLSMAPYRTNAIGTGNFGSYLTNTYLTAQSNGVALSNYTSFAIKTIYNRELYATTNSTFMGLVVYTNFTDTAGRMFYPRDLAGICLNTGRVTKEMLRVHAQDYWQVVT